MKKKVVALTALSVLLALCFVLKNHSPAETLPESGTQESRSAPAESEAEQAPNSGSTNSGSNEGPIDVDN